jgi:hypothetical protein
MANFFPKVNSTKFSTFGCIWIGVSSSNESIPVVRSFYARSHAIGSTCCYISRERHRFEWPNGIQPIWEGNAKVSGCGLLLSPKDQLSIFFTVNGVLLCEFWHTGDMELGGGKIWRLIPFLHRQANSNQPFGGLSVSKCLHRKSVDFRGQFWR